MQQSPPKGRVLVVDDSRDTVDLLVHGIQMLGYSCATAVDAHEALRVAREFKPHVALLDIGLPEINGYDLAAKLREALGESLVLVAVTGYVRDSDRERALAAGFAAHVAKPFDLDDLRGLLAEIVPPM
ncbi:MAG TPA: response regulator [Polyangiaceae bacterium]|jgi:CheY-like chemotaxis protein